MAGDRTPRSGLTLRQLALAGALGCALAAAAYTVAMSESPIGPVSVSPLGIATNPTQGTGRSGDTQIAADRNWADKLHRAPIETNSRAPLLGSKSSTPPVPPAQSGSAIGPGAVPISWIVVNTH